MLSTDVHNFACAGYLVEDKKVLLVFHKKFQKWVPPGGHVEHGETFSETVAREFKEETNLRIEVISSAPIIHLPDDNATPLPVPFYADLECEGFKKPTIVQFYFVKRVSGHKLAHQTKELDDIGWFTKDQLQTLETFAQVRSLATYAIRNFPTN